MRPQKVVGGSAFLGDELNPEARGLQSLLSLVTVEERLS